MPVEKLFVKTRVMERLKKVKGWVFDLDGTLVDSKLDFDELRSLLAMPPKLPILEYLETLEASERQRLMKIVDDYEWQGHERATLIDGVGEFLDFLHVREIPCALLTRNSERVAHATLKKFDLHFDLVISRDHPFRPKPHPDGLLFISEKLSLGPSHLVYVGDFYFDMEAAKNAGSLGLYFNPESDQVPEIADLSFTSYSELIKFLAPL